MKSDPCQLFTKEKKEKLLRGFKGHADQELVELIRCDWIHPPPSGNLNLEKPDKEDFS